MAKNNSKHHEKKVKKLYRSNKNKMIAGVCGGIGEYLNVDPTVIRIIYVIFTVVAWWGTAGIIAYLLLWIIVPERYNY